MSSTPPPTPARNLSSGYLDQRPETPFGKPKNRYFRLTSAPIPLEALKSLHDKRVNHHAIDYKKSNAKLFKTLAIAATTGDGILACYRSDSEDHLKAPVGLTNLRDLENVVEGKLKKQNSLTLVTATGKDLKFVAPTEVEAKGWVKSIGTKIMDLVGETPVEENEAYLSVYEALASKSAFAPSVATSETTTAEVVEEGAAKDKAVETEETAAEHPVEESQDKPVEAATAPVVVEEEPKPVEQVVMVADNEDEVELPEAVETVEETAETVEESVETAEAVEEPVETAVKEETKTEEPAVRKPGAFRRFTLYFTKKTVVAAPSDAEEETTATAVEESEVTVVPTEVADESVPESSEPVAEVVVAVEHTADPVADSAVVEAVIDEIVEAVAADIAAEPAAKAAEDAEETPATVSQKKPFLRFYVPRFGRTAAPKPEATEPEAAVTAVEVPKSDVEPVVEPVVESIAASVSSPFGNFMSLFKRKSVVVVVAAAEPAAAAGEEETAAAENVGDVPVVEETASPEEVVEVQATVVEAEPVAIATIEPAAAVIVVDSKADDVVALVDEAVAPADEAVAPADEAVAPVEDANAAADKKPTGVATFLTRVNSVFKKTPRAPAQTPEAETSKDEAVSVAVPAIVVVDTETDGSKA